jgi:periplasmic protein TonB
MLVERVLRVMSEAAPRLPTEDSSAGHVYIRADDGHAVDVPFLFERQGQRMGRTVIASIASHAAIFLVALFGIRYGSQTATTTPELPFQPNSSIIWLTQPGPGGGGGGGGTRMEAPPRQAEQPGKDKITVPVSKPPKLEPPKQPQKEPDPIEQLNIPAKNLAAATESLPGAIEAVPALPTLSQGSGTGGGAGTGAGSGVGPGTGSGLGPGSGGGTGGGAYRPGSGVTLPRLIREVKPNYTSDAMRAKVQGTVLVECVVTTSGEVTDVKILRSLDQTFGLDQEAVKAARQWRFQPGTRLGEPVPVIISIELSFTLR